MRRTDLAIFIFHEPSEVLKAVVRRSVHDIFYFFEYKIVKMLKIDGWKIKIEHLLIKNSKFEKFKSTIRQHRRHGGLRDPWERIDGATDWQ